VSNDDLQCWFGLSYASWLTMPRVLMQEMPDEWQQKMSDLLNEFDATYTNVPEVSTRVLIVDGGKYTKIPHWLVNYRHPNRALIESFKK